MAKPAACLLVIANFCSLLLAAQGVKRREWNVPNVLVSGLPSERQAQGAAADGGLFIVGGVNTDDGQIDVYRFDTIEEQWADLSDQMTGDIPPAVSKHRVVALRDAIYLLGGEDFLGNELQGLYVFNTTTLSWSEVGEVSGDGPGSRTYPALAAAQIGESDLLFVHGGQQNGAKRNDFFEFNITAKRWRQLNSPDLREVDRPFGRDEHGMVATGNTLYIYGGWLVEPSVGTGYFPTTQRIQVYSYQYSADGSADWRSLQFDDIEHGTETISPQSRKGHSVVAHDGWVYVFGGETHFTDIRTGDTYLRYIEQNITDGDYPPKFFRFRCCDADNEFDNVVEWTRIPTDIAARSYSSMVLFESTIYLFGGTSGSLPDEGENINHFYSVDMDAVTDSAEQSTELTTWVDRNGVVSGDGPLWRSNFAFAAVGSKLVTFGGQTENGNPREDVHEFDLTSSRWKYKGSMVTGNGRTPQNPMATAWGDHIYVIVNTDRFPMRRESFLYQWTPTSGDEGIFELLSTIDRSLGRKFAGMLAYEGALFVYGGLSSGFFAGDDIVDEMLMFELSDPARGWINLEPRFVGARPSARALMGFEVCGGLFFVHGGSGGADGLQLFDDLWSFDPSTLQWKELSPADGVAPSARRGHGFVCNAGNLFLFGGGIGPDLDDEGGLDEGSDSEFWQYHVANNRWSFLSDGLTGLAPNRRTLFGMVSAVGSIFMAGGYPGVSDLERLKLEILPKTPREVEWPSSVAGWSNIVDWDVVAISSSVSVRSQVTLCTAVYPCQLNLLGRGGTLVLEQDGGLVCNVVTGCTLVNLESVVAECAGDSSRSVPMVQVTGSAIVATGSHFQGCVSEREGGAIWSYGSSSISVRGSQFNYTRSLASGGAIALFGGTLNVQDTQFVGCQSNKYGGAIFADEFVSYPNDPLQAVVSIASSSFMHCTAREGSSLSSRGGGIYVSKAELHVHDSHFENCSSNTGGGIGLDASMGSVHDTVFRKNTATGVGGGLSSSSGNIGILRSLFASNIARSGGGGGISLVNAEVTLTQVSAWNNLAPSGGGGTLMITGAQQPKVDGVGLSCGVVDAVWKCPPGQTGEDGGPCEPCRPGFWKDAMGSDACTPCPFSQWSPPNSVQEENCTCNAGTSPSSDVCEPCAAGTFKQFPGLEGCTACPDGTYQTEEGASSCVQCPEGTFQDGSHAEQSCQPCPDGTSSAAGSRSEADCSQQFAAIMAWSGACSGLCHCDAYLDPSGVISDGSESELYEPNSNCAWMIGPLGAVQVSLEFDSFMTQAGNATANTGDFVTVMQCDSLDCPIEGATILFSQSGSDTPVAPIISRTGFMMIRFTSDSAANRGGFSARWTSSAECDEGFFKNGSRCSACSQSIPESAAHVRESEAGAPCGWECNAGFSRSNSSCVACPQGSTSQRGGPCICLPGYTGPQCGACEAGKYKDVNGSDECNPCPLGSYQDATMATTCTLCEEGTYGDGVSSSACQSCPEGSSSSPAGSQSDAECLCAAGYTGSGGMSCTACEAGKYKDAEGPEACSPCPPGSFQLSSQSTMCDLCEAGKFSVNETFCARCPDRSSSAQGSTSFGQCECAPGYEGISADACTACASGTFKDVVGPGPCEACASCPDGQIATDGCDGTLDIVCTNCPEGSYRSGEYEQCMSCPRGFSSVPGSSHVTSCFHTSTGNCIGQVFVDDVGEFSDARPLEMYTPGSNCSWIISPPSAETISLSFTFVDIACEANLLVWECLNWDCTSSEQLFGHNGTHFRGSIVSRTGSMMITLTSSESSGQGFTAQWNSTFCNLSALPQNAEYVGSLSRGVTCEWVCREGFYRSIAGCQACPDNSTSKMGSSDSSQCLCMPGFSGEEGGPCHPCEPGTFKDDLGSSACGCQSGFYISNSTCVECPENSTSTTGASSLGECLCAAGYTGTDSSNCRPCPAGTFKDTSGSSECTACVGEAYQNQAGSTSCDVCPGGSFRIGNSASAVCERCPPGTTSAAGTEMASCSKQMFVSQSCMDWCECGMLGTTSGMVQKFADGVSGLRRGWRADNLNVPVDDLILEDVDDFFGRQLLYHDYYEDYYCLNGYLEFCHEEEETTTPTPTTTPMPTTTPAPGREVAFQCRPRAAVDMGSDGLRRQQSQERQNRQLLYHDYYEDYYCLNGYLEFCHEEETTTAEPTSTPTPTTTPSPFSSLSDLDIQCRSDARRHGIDFDYNGAADDGDEDREEGQGRQLLYHDYYEDYYCLNGYLEFCHEEETTTAEPTTTPAPTTPTLGVFDFRPLECVCRPMRAVRRSSADPLGGDFDYYGAADDGDEDREQGQGRQLLYHDYYEDYYCLNGYLEFCHEEETTSAEPTTTPTPTTTPGPRPQPTCECQPDSVEHNQQPPASRRLLYHDYYEDYYCLNGYLEFCHEEETTSAEPTTTPTPTTTPAPSQGPCGEGFHLNCSATELFCDEGYYLDCEASQDICSDGEDLYCVIDEPGDEEQCEETLPSGTCAWIISPPEAIEITLTLDMMTAGVSEVVVSQCEASDSCEQPQILERFSGPVEQAEVLVSGPSMMVEFNMSHGLESGEGLQFSWETTTECEAGTYRIEDGPVLACARCVAGKYKDSSGTEECSNCPAGTFSEAGALNCTACPRGTFNDVEASPIMGCVGCVAGSYANETGTVTCLPCPPGWFQDQPNSTGCQKCPNSTYRSESDDPSSCQACPHSATDSAETSTSVLDCQCNAGFSGEAGGPCEACGAYASKLVWGTAPCVCNPGYTGPDDGFCTPCEVGTYKSEFGNSSCAPCPLNSISPEGSTSRFMCACQDGFVGESGQDCFACNRSKENVCDAAEYGACTASSFDRLFIVYPEVVTVGVPFSVTLYKKDAYNQTISTDSVSTLNVRTVQESSDDADLSVIISGASTVPMKKGEATFDVAVRPSYLHWTNHTTQLFRHPFLRFDGADAESVDVATQDQMTVEKTRIATLTDRDVCPRGMILELQSAVEEHNNGRVGGCDICEAGKYSIDPLYPDPDSADPFCLPCPRGGDCVLGGSEIRFDTGDWTAVDGIFKLEHCPAGFSLANKDFNGEFDHFEQRCIQCSVVEYVVNPDVHPCQPCPEGAECDGSALLAKQEGEVWEADPVVGIYRLISCPPGHQLVNSTDGTSKGTFSAPVQKCQPCIPETQYILKPNLHACQPCPVGLTCDGTATLSPVVTDSKWTVRGEEYILESCPQGFYVLNTTLLGFDAVVQECRPCPAGMECTSPTCTVCSLCAPGHYKDSVSTSPCSECPKNTYRGDYGGTQLDDCSDCPANSQTLVDSFNSGAGYRTAQTHIENCTCNTQFYLALQNDGSPVCKTCPAGAVCDDRTCALWSSDQTCQQPDGTEVLVTGIWRQEVDDESGEQIYKLAECPPGHSLVKEVGGKFNHDAQACNECGLGEYIMVPNLEVCKTCPAGMTCIDNFFEARVPKSVWATELRYSPSGVQETYLVLRDCPIGYLIVNHTLEDQQCIRCEPLTYSFSPTDACEETDQGVICGPRQCQDCPAGADCIGGTECTPDDISSADGCDFQDGFQPKVGTIADWEKAAHPRKGDTQMVYRLNVCPAGFILVRNESSELFDECIQCPATSYSVQPANYAENFLTVDRAERVPDQCLSCHPAAVCGGGDDIVPNVGFWKQDDAVARRELDNSTEVVVYRCPVDACLEGGQCRDGHMNPVCGLCKPGYAMSGNICTVCGEAKPGQYQRIFLGVVLPLFLLIWYFLSWRPFFARIRSHDDPEQGGICAHACFQTDMCNNAKLAIVKAADSDFTDFVKIFISFWQIVGTFDQTYSVKFPEILSRMWEFGSALSFDFFDIPGPSCITADWGYLKILQAYTMTPALISFLLWVPTMLLMCARKTKTARYKNVADSFWFTFLFWLFLIYPILSTKTIQGFHCRKIANQNLLVVDLRRECPLDDYSSPAFLWALVTTVIYPFGIPVLFFVVLVWNKVPELARKKEDRALFSQLISIYKSSKSATVSGKLATHIGRVATKSGHETSITSAAKHIFDLLKDRGDEASYHNLLGYLHDVGVAQPDDLEEFNDFFNQFDHDKDAALDWAEFQEMTLSVLKNDYVLNGTESLETIRHDQLDALCSYRWNSLFEKKNDSSDDVKVQVLKKALKVRDKPKSDDDEGEIYRLPDNATSGQKLEWLLMVARKLKGEELISLPVLTWDASTVEERNALDRYGFLFEAYEVQFWYYEILEMLRKFTMTCVIIFMYPEKPQQLASGFIVTLLYLVVFIKAEPYSNPQVDKMQAASLLTQAATLFYGLMSSVTELQKETDDDTGRDTMIVLLVMLHVLIFAILFFHGLSLAFPRIKLYFQSDRVQKKLDQFSLYRRYFKPKNTVANRYASRRRSYEESFGQSERFMIGLPGSTRAVGMGRSSRAQDPGDVKAGWRQHHIAHPNSGSSRFGRQQSTGSNASGKDRRAATGTYKQKIKAAQAVQNGRVVGVKKKEPKEAAPAANNSGTIVHYWNGNSPIQDEAFSPPTPAFRDDGAGPVVHYWNGTAPTLDKTVWEPPQAVSSMKPEPAGLHNGNGDHPREPPPLADYQNYSSKLAEAHVGENGSDDSKRSLICQNGAHDEETRKAIDSALGFAMLDYTGPDSEIIHYVPHLVPETAANGHNSAITHFWSERPANGGNSVRDPPPRNPQNVLVQYEDATPGDSTSTQDLTVLNRYQDLSSLQDDSES